MTAREQLGDLTSILITTPTITIIIIIIAIATTRPIRLGHIIDARCWDRQ